MWSLVTNRQQIKRFGVAALLFWRHYRHQVAPEPQEDNKAVRPPSSLNQFFSSHRLFPFCFSLFFFSTLLSSLFSPSAFCLYVSVCTSLSLTTSCSPSIPSPPLCFVLPFFLSSSPDSVHMRRFKRAAVSHTMGNSQPFSVVVWFHNTGAEDQIKTVSMTLVFHTTAA